MNKQKNSNQTVQTLSKNEYDTCLRCGRKLKNPESRKIGYGVICAAKVQFSRKRSLFDI